MAFDLNLRAKFKNMDNKYEQKPFAESHKIDAKKSDGLQSGARMSKMTQVTKCLAWLLILRKVSKLA